MAEALSNSAQFAFRYNKFFGPELTSFGEKTQGYGVLIGVTKKNAFLGLSTGIQLDTLSGQQNLMDGSTKKSISFSGYGASAYLGARLTPLMSATFLNPYLVGGGMAGITYIANGTANLTQLSGSESPSSFGYYLGFGIERGGSNGRISPFLEMRFEYEKGTFFGVKNFQKDKVCLMLGLNY